MNIVISYINIKTVNKEKLTKQKKNKQLAKTVKIMILLFEKVPSEMKRLPLTPCNRQCQIIKLKITGNIGKI